MRLCWEIKQRRSSKNPECTAKKAVAKVGVILEHSEFKVSSNGVGEGRRAKISVMNWRPIAVTVGESGESPFLLGPQSCFGKPLILH